MTCRAAVYRLIDNVQQAEGSKTVTLATRQGLMGNLFKLRCTMPTVPLPGARRHP